MPRTKSDCTRLLLLAVISGLFAMAQVQPPTTVAAPMPYVAIHNPQFVPADQTPFLEDDDVVIGVTRGRVAKAFPAADLIQHGSVNDDMPDGPIEVTWCGVCNTGAVFQAKFKGQTLNFEYDSMVSANEVHRDRETGSRWQQSTGEAISGPLKGARLELYPSIRTTWKEWRRRFPQSMVLKPLPGYLEQMPSRRARIKNAMLRTDGPPPNGALASDERLLPRETVAGLQVAKHSKAYPFSILRAQRVVNDHMGSVKILVVHQPASDTTTAFEARAKGRTLRFHAVDEDATVLTDAETRSKWDAYGHCVEGPLKGAQLRPLILMAEFWFAWSQFHPGTSVFTAEQPK